MCYTAQVAPDFLQSNLCITTTWGTKFLWSLQTGGFYTEGLCITVKTVNSDIWSLYKGSIIFHLITHDTDKNKSAYIFLRNKKLCCDKTTYYKKHIFRIYYDFQDKHFVQWSLYSGNEKPGTSFKWSLAVLYRWLLYREKPDLKT